MKKASKKGNLKRSVIVERTISVYELFVSLFIIFFDAVTSIFSRTIRFILSPIATKIYTAYKQGVERRKEEKIIKAQELIKQDIEEQILLAKEIIKEEFGVQEEVAEVETIEKIPEMQEIESIIEETKEESAKRYSFFNKESGKHAKERVWHPAFTMQAACAILVSAMLILVSPTQSVFTDYVHSVSNVEMGDWGKPVITLEGISPMTMLIRNYI